MPSKQFVFSRPVSQFFDRGCRQVGLALAIGGVMALVLGGCGDKAKDDLDEAVTGRDKIAAGVGAAVTAELDTVANEVASWYTIGEGDPKVVTSGGSYYICAATESDCVTNGQVISGASGGVQMTLARSGKDNWCLQAVTDSAQYHTGPGASAEDGPC
jgi:hypothetical protein